MANSNLIQRQSLWLFIAGMFAFIAFIIGLIFYLAEAHPAVLYDTLKLLCLQDHDLNHLLTKIDDLEHKTQSQEHRIQSLEHEVEVLKADVKTANMQTTELLIAGLTIFVFELLIYTLKSY